MQALAPGEGLTEQQLLDLKKRTSWGAGANGEFQCLAISTLSGVRCLANPVAGDVHCFRHGGGAPEHRWILAKRLHALVSPALDTLYECLTATDGAGDPDWSIRKDAAKAILDRAGYGPRATVAFERPGVGNDDLSTLTTADLLNMLEDTYARAKSVVNNPSAIEGEVVRRDDYDVHNAYSPTRSTQDDYT